MSQEATLLKELKKAGNKGITNHYMANHLRILKYSSRIAELRKEGHNIYCEQQQNWFTGKCTGTFKYYLNKEDK